MNLIHLKGIFQLWSPKILSKGVSLPQSHYKFLLSLKEVGRLSNVGFIFSHYDDGLLRSNMANMLVFFPSLASTVQWWFAQIEIWPA